MEDYTLILYHHFLCREILKTKNSQKKHQGQQTMPTKQETDFIPTHMYNKIVKLMPIVSVEAAIQIDGAFLLLKRNNQPAKGEWWFPGGRIKKGETLQQALIREVKEETDLTITQHKLINVYSRVFPQRHDITIAYHCRVKEAKVKLECRVTEIKSLGNEGGAGQLVFAEVICMHIDDSVLNETRTMIDQTKLQHIARLGGDWYSVVNAQSLFKVPKPNTKVGIGVDGLPDNIRNSKVLTGNNLGMLANVTGIPDIDPNFEDDTLKHIVIYYSLNPEEMERELHIYAVSLLDAGKIDAAWQVLLAMIY